MFINNSQRQVVPFASHREGSVGARPEIDWRRNHFDKDLFLNEKRKCNLHFEKRWNHGNLSSFAHAKDFFIPFARKFILGD